MRIFNLFTFPDFYNSPGNFNLVSCAKSKIETFRAKVRLGEHRISTNPDCYCERSSSTNPGECPDAISDECNDTPQDFDIEEIKFHPDYNRPTVFRNDIAIIKLAKPANFTGKFNNHKKLSVYRDLTTLPASIDVY